MNRDANISVVSDSQSLVALIPNNEAAGVTKADNGQLSISIADPGVNVNSIYQFGYLTETYPKVTPDWSTLETTSNPVGASTDDFESPFLISNQTDSTMSITFTLDLTSNSSDAGHTRFLFEIHDSSEKLSGVRYPDQTAAPSLELDPGDALGVSFVVNSYSGDVGDFFTASLTVEPGAVS
ncbi:hypothetical protein B9H04_10450 [Halorubrum ezzemoulense DSM 17463]|uniref:DUF1102 domain-containing protein n=1 Tax=Halorubrum ezzemoulense DSM 17463 TaxID=1121945 RepID=A0A1X4GLL4_HALEZ|nr:MULTISPECIES: hypothetical protein [Halorubrum]OSO98497.1 hypothetical protein B9H04_10450 [Halorubrum ezzemoulense DSM 17463]TKX38384.1 hypothetical protein EXE51_03840 [Halorubrum sp. CGM5_25_10-8B]